MPAIPSESSNGVNEHFILYINAQHHLDACIHLLNQKWPRSRRAREITFERLSGDSGCLPQSLLLIINDKLIGHARICAVPGRPTDCWIESVIVDEIYRGKGLGRRLMEASEQFAADLGFTTAILSTHDQQKFYERCGYTPCAPVCVAGSAAGLFARPQFAAFCGKVFHETSPPTETRKNTECESLDSRDNVPGTSQQISELPPTIIPAAPLVPPEPLKIPPVVPAPPPAPMIPFPPAPPLPVGNLGPIGKQRTDHTDVDQDLTRNEELDIQYMKKEIKVI